MSGQIVESKDESKFSVVQFVQHLDLTRQDTYTIADKSTRPTTVSPYNGPTVLRKRKKDGKFIRLITAQYSFLDESIYDTSLNKEYFCVVGKAE